MMIGVAFETLLTLICYISASQTFQNILHGDPLPHTFSTRRHLQQG